MSSHTLIRGTLLSLLKPKRLLPMLFVSVPLLWAQKAFSRDVLALPLGVLMCTLFIAVAPLSYRVLFNEHHSLRHAVLRVILYTLIGVGVVLTVGQYIPDALGMGRTFLTDRHSLTICAALFLVGGWGLGRDIALEDSLDKERARAEQLKREAELSQLLALRSHLDPHFLFNTLNAIAEWCREDGEVAERAVLELSSILRTVLAAVHKKRWPLSEELHLVRTLFALHLLRDPSRFTFELQAPDELLEIELPPMLLLPLAENAVKHGPSAGHRGHIRVEVTRDGGALCIEVKNPGAYRGPREGSLGIPTLRRRVELAYGSAAQLSLGAHDENNTVARVQLPLHGPMGACA